MASIQGKNTRPEITIRKMLWQKGLRYRIHNKTIFGTPDISIKKKKLAVFIDGCFWHGCKRCYEEPKSNVKFWRKKIKDNRKRRTDVKSRLKSEGWKIIEMWEHEINDNPKKTAEQIEIYIKNINLGDNET